MMPMIDSVTSKFRTHGVMAIAGKNGNEKRRKPCVPIFSRTPARMIEPAVGASTCASGSQVWNGNIGTLMAKPARSNKKIKTWGLDHDPTPCHRDQRSVASPRVSSGIENVKTLFGE